MIGRRASVALFEWGSLVRCSRLTFNRMKDELHVNGTFLYADYMDVHHGKIGFFRENDPSQPIVLLVGQAIVEIELTENPDGSRVLILEQPYDEA